MGLTFPGLGHHCCYIPIEIHMQREALTLMLYVAIRGMLTPGFFPFQHRLSREQYRAFEISIASSLC
jgi:hypothetical protein